MQMLQRGLWSRLLSALVLASCSARGLSEPAPAEAKPEVLVERDGQHDFDFEFGRWKAHLRRLLHPLTGSNEWVELEGTSIVRKVWHGRANLGEIVLDNPTTHLEGLSLRLYNPQSGQWSIY